MSTVQDRPPGAIDPPVYQVDLADPAARAGWLADLREQTTDILTAALDATAPPAARDLGRRAARRIITEAESKLAALFAVVGGANVRPAKEPSPTRPSIVPTPATDEADEADEIRRLREGWIDLVVGALNAEQRRAHLQGASLPALLLYALGEPREAVEVEPVVIAVLDAIRSTVEGWATDLPERGAVHVSHHDMHVLVRRMDVAIEILRRSGGGGS